MSQTTRGETTSSFIVKDSMNHQGAITLEETDGHATFHVVDYADIETEERLASLTEGAQVRMAVERAGVRANVWKATKLVAGTSKASPVRV